MPNKYGAKMTAAQHKKNLLTENPVVDKSKGMGGAGMYPKKGASMGHKKPGMSMGHKKDGMSMKKYGESMGYKKPGMSMSGEKYDAKQAYNKNLTAKARLHYLENERHDKTHAHPILKHMRKM